MLLDKKCWPGFPSQGRGNLALWGCRKEQGRGGEEDIAGERWGADTDLRVRAMLSSAKVPPGCAVTQASPEAETTLGEAQTISAIFPF